MATSGERPACPCPGTKASLSGLPGLCSDGSCEVLRDPNQRGPMTQNLFPMLVEGPPARRRLVYETLKEFAEPQEILIGSLQLYLRDGNVEPLVVGSGLLEDLGSRSWPVLEAYAQSAQPACAYFVPAIARLKGVTAEKRCAVLEILARSEDSELRLRAHWALDGSPPDDMIRISVPGKAAYPLRRPIGLRIFPLPSGGFFIEPVRSELRDILSGKGTTVEEARNDFGCRFDRLIQENRAIPRHDRTPENERIAGILGDLVDWDRYEQENPLIQPIWGQVRELPGGWIAPDFLGHRSERGKRPGGDPRQPGCPPVARRDPGRPMVLWNGAVLSGSCHLGRPAGGCPRSRRSGGEIGSLGEPSR